MKNSLDMLAKMFNRRHDNQHTNTQHNDIQHNNIQHKFTQHSELICDTQHK
jgi:hypothetical protein